ncbi:(d)CMP kinase [[Clostridium] fimetarium]|uniref:Cytidylate kinase n=1 Tax=[Clostridium] fimetarium TaxID=99656 RepID=A0A1I0QN70_9FIRM|nr:(d)CMP kinase [[Clostridium] fimetarium]SEW28639.1 cytidylate kinase [[Clostridium] fimetarium]
MAYAIAIDGPAGAGKSTIAKSIAKKLQYIYVDTGAMYRAIAIYFIKNNIDPTDENAINKACEHVDITIAYLNGEQQVILNGENITSILRNEEVGKIASKTSIYAKVRKKLVELQRELARTTDCIMDGRDIGTTVLPNANVKIYLTASVEARASRRYKELIEKGESPSYEVIKSDIENRDYQDMNRENSPLKQADDAVLIDSSNIDLDETIETIIKVINENI